MTGIRALASALGAVMLLISGSVCAEQETPPPTNTLQPKRFITTYELSTSSITLGEMRRQLYFDDQLGLYVFSSYSKPKGYAKWFVSTTLDERSHWLPHNNMPRPVQYRYDRQGGSSNKERHVKMDFKWDEQQGRVTTVVNGDPWKMDVPPNTLDKLLYHLAVMYDLKSGKRSGLEYDVADGGKLKHYSFEILGEETVKTELGEFHTLKLKSPGRRDTIIWCAPELDYLPVQLEQEEKRGTLLMQMTSLELDGRTYKKRKP